MLGRMTAPHTHSFRVYYDDTDAGGIVYYANYFKFAERARTEWLRTLGFESGRLRATHHILIVVKKAAADYIAPARLDDGLVVETRVEQMGGSSMTLAQDVFRVHADGVGRDPLCVLQIVLVCVDATSGRPTRWPDSLRTAISG